MDADDADGFVVFYSHFHLPATIIDCLSIYHGMQLQPPDVENGINEVKMEMSICPFSLHLKGIIVCTIPRAIFEPKMYREK